jgi:NTE family protein
MDATLVDRMIEDLRTLIKVNTLVDSTERVTATGRPQRAIPFLAIAPPARATLGQLAEQIFQNQRERWQGVVPTLRRAELRMLGRAVGGGGPRRGDLFSYLYFDPEFIEASIELGRSNAEAVFAGLPPDQLPWQTRPGQLITAP